MSPWIHSSQDSDDDGNNQPYQWNETFHRTLRGLFPKSLEILHLGCCEWHFQHLIYALTDLLLHKTAFVPRLTTVVLDGLDIDELSITTPRVWHDLSELDACTKTNGVSLIAVHEDKPPRQDNETGMGGIERGWGMDGSIRWAEGADSFDRLLPYKIIDIPRSVAEGKGLFRGVYPI